MVKSNFRRVARKVAKSVKKRYFKGKGYSRPKVSKIASDLNMIKTMVNAEKEIYTAYSVTNKGVSPTSSVIEPITNIAEGNSHGQRNGESVKLHGFRLQARFNQQGSAVTDQYFKLWLVKYVGPRGTTPSVSTFLNTDFDGNYSASSERNEDWYSSYQVITAMSGKIAADTVSGLSRYVLKKTYGRFRGKTHQRYSGALETNLLTDQMYVIMVASNGAIGTSTALNVDAKLLISFYDN